MRGPMDVRADRAYPAIRPLSSTFPFTPIYQFATLGITLMSAEEQARTHIDAALRVGPRRGNAHPPLSFMLDSCGISVGDQ
jgi:hypothetical protein